MVQTRANDEHEQRLLDDVRDHGWHLIGVGDDPQGPGFLYSVGLFHNFGHPEIIVFGMNSISAMGQVVNVIGSLVRQGRTFSDRSESDEILEGYSCSFRQVPADVYPDYLGYAMWYYRPDDFPVLQCVWPDKNGFYPWQSDCDSWVRGRQPLLAHLRGWRFYESKDQAVFTTCFVLDENYPILRVVHDADGDWQFLCGTTNRTEDGRIVCLEHIVELNPGVDELADLPRGWAAERDAPGSPWTRFPVEPLE